MVETRKRRCCKTESAIIWRRHEPPARPIPSPPLFQSLRGGFAAPILAGPPVSTGSGSTPQQTRETTSFLPPKRKQSFDAYAYSFWRGGRSGSGLAAAGQYGGGQSGLIATIGLQETDGRTSPLALLIRTSIAHDRVREREIALGVRWQPAQSLPLSLSAERRFRNSGPDGFALYLAGGRSEIRLPAKFALEAYAQAGVVSGKTGGRFFDATARAGRQVLPAIHAGAGIWAGGQRNAARLDIGPTLRTELPVGANRIRIAADWRFRIAGDASPGNGPALTLSTGF